MPVVRRRPPEVSMLNRQSFLHLMRVVAVVGLAAGSPIAATAAGAREPQARNRVEGSTAVVGRGVSFGSWQDLSMPDTGGLVGPFRISSTAPIAVSFADFLCAGDRLALYDGARYVATGTQMPLHPTCDIYTGVPEEAFLDGRFSAGLELLPAGAHSLYFKSDYTFTDGFGAAFRVDRCTIVAHGEAKLIGTRSRDVMCGSSLPEQLIGKGGNDLILAAGGADSIDSTGGGTAASGGDGNDRITVHGESSRVFAQGGNDTATTGHDGGALDGGAGDDLLQGSPGNDVLSGGDGADRLVAGAGYDLCDGGSGVDTWSGCESIRRLP